MVELDVPDVLELLDEVPWRSLSLSDEPLVALLPVAPGVVPVLPPSPVADEPEPLSVPLPDAEPDADPLALPLAEPPLPVAEELELGAPVVPDAEPVAPLVEPLVAPLCDRSLLVPLEEPLPEQPAKAASAAAITTATKDFLISMDELLS
ncbi:MAG: hypothetical protein ACT4P8_00195 [Betaproteobacteria bacterium]